MKRIDTTYRKVDLFGPGKDGFTGGTPGVEAATRINSDWFNRVQEEICNVVEGAGLALDGSDYGQMFKAVVLPQILRGLLGHPRIEDTGAGDVVLTFACEDYAPAVPTEKSYGHAIVGVGSSVLMVSLDFGYNWSDLESGANVYAAVAIKPGADFIAVAGGTAGQWKRVTASGGAIAVAGSGTITGDITHLAWDPINNLWWAAGASRFSRNTDANLAASGTEGTWTQLGSVEHQGICVLPSGRVVTYRPSDDKLYYSDDQATLVAGGVTGMGVGSTIGSMVYDPGSEQILFTKSGSGTLYMSTDGSAVTSTAAFSAGSAVFHRVIVFKGTPILVSAYGAIGEQRCNLLYVPKNGQFSPDPADWIAVAAPNRTTPVLAYCGSFAVTKDPHQVTANGGGLIGILPVVPDPFGLF